MAKSRPKLADEFAGGSRHEPTSDAARINSAVERAARYTSFIDNSVGF
ncbi:MAG TPA: hypothetical protein VGQ03_09195 [Nitrososphaera sp.]|nr:hypothetical protein [Nitrososphaera sp.]